MNELLTAYSPDILFRVQYAGSSRPLYLLCEHQSRTDWRMPHRMLRYRLLMVVRKQNEQPDASRRLPVVIPMVAPLAPAGIGSALDDLDGENMDARRRPGLSPRTMLILWSLGNAQRLMDARSDGEIVEILGAASDLMAQTLDTAQGRDALDVVLRHVLETIDIPPDRLQALLEIALDPRVFGVFMTTAEQIRQEGWASGQRAMLLKLVTQHLGPLSEDLMQRIRHAPSHLLDTWSERMLTARTLDDVFEAEDPAVED